MWQNKNFDEENLVKMGDIGNFNSLVASLHSTKDDELREVGPDALAKRVVNDELF